MTPRRARRATVTEPERFLGGGNTNADDADDRTLLECTWVGSTPMERWRMKGKWKWKEKEKEMMKEVEGEGRIRFAAGDLAKEI